MTKRKLNPQQQLRADIDTVTTAIITQAQQMIQEDVPVVLAYRLAISFELEATHYRNLAEMQQTVLGLVDYIRKQKDN